MGVELHFQRFKNQCTSQDRPLLVLVQRLRLHKNGEMDSFFRRFVAGFWHRMGTSLQVTFYIHWVGLGHLLLFHCAVWDFCHQCETPRFPHWLGRRRPQLQRLNFFWNGPFSSLLDQQLLYLHFYSGSSVGAECLSQVFILFDLSLSCTCICERSLLELKQLIIVFFFYSRRVSFASKICLGATTDRIFRCDTELLPASQKEFLWLDLILSSLHTIFGLFLKSELYSITCGYKFND